MPRPTLRPLPLDLPNADARSLVALHEHQNIMQLLNHADALPVPLDVHLAAWRNLGPSVRCWVVWNEAAIIANAWTELAVEGKNANVVNFNIMVQPTYRKRGLGRALLAAVAEYAQAAGSSTMITQTGRHRPEGEIWMRRIGAMPTIESRSSRLALAEVNVDLVETWVQRAAERAGGYTLEFWNGYYPEIELDAIANLYTIHDNVSPLSSANADVVVGANQIRRQQDDLFGRGFACWTAIVRERSTTRLVGITEISWNTKQAEVLEQGITVVLPEHRNRGLGRWLKAAMAQKVLRERPQARFIHTGNAATNMAMLKLNRELGFVPLSQDTWWEMRVSQVRQYVEKSGTGGHKPE